MFFETLEKVADHIDQPLVHDAHRALESALRYFREAAPKHTADEEESVFPRLRQSSDPEVKAALAAFDVLEQKHRHAESLHAQVEMLGKLCLEQGQLPTSEAIDFRQAVADLGSIYQISP